MEVDAVHQGLETTVAKRCRPLCGRRSFIHSGHCRRTLRESRRVRDSGRRLCLRQGWTSLASKMVACPDRRLRCCFEGETECVARCLRNAVFFEREVFETARKHSQQNRGTAHHRQRCVVTPLLQPNGHVCARVSEKASRSAWCCAKQCSVRFRSSR